MLSAVILRAHLLAFITTLASGLPPLISNDSTLSTRPLNSSNEDLVCINEVQFPDWAEHADNLTIDVRDCIDVWLSMEQRYKNIGTKKFTFYSKKFYPHGLAPALSGFALPGYVQRGKVSTLLPSSHRQESNLVETFPLAPCLPTLSNNFPGGFLTATLNLRNPHVLTSQTPNASSSPVWPVTSATPVSLSSPAHQPPTSKRPHSRGSRPRRGKKSSWS